MTIAADWRPRMSPPSRFGGFERGDEAIGEVRLAASNARPSPARPCLDHHVGLDGVLIADLVAGDRDAPGPGVGATAPVASTIATWRPSRPVSAATSCSRAFGAGSPGASARGPAGRRRARPATAWRRRRHRPRPTRRSTRPRTSATGPRRPSRRSPDRGRRSSRCGPADRRSRWRPRAGLNRRGRGPRRGEWLRAWRILADRDCLRILWRPACGAAARPARRIADARWKAALRRP